MVVSSSYTAIKIAGNQYLLCRYPSSLLSHRSPSAGISSEAFSRGGLVQVRGSLDRGDSDRAHRGDLDRGDLDRGDLDRGDLDRGDLVRGNLELVAPWLYGRGS